MPRQLPQGQLPCGDSTLRTPNHEQTARGAHRLCGRARRGGVHLQEQTSRSSVPSAFPNHPKAKGFISGNRISTLRGVRPGLR